ncbi:MAG: trypsin-like peptidase domain-containing protein [Oscillospiraceae bacterium]|nr:trypsin-like peptidase domain-containing protein [Oscillospiraceae bacterium]
MNDHYHFEIDPIDEDSADNSRSADFGGSAPETEHGGANPAETAESGANSGCPDGEYRFVRPENCSWSDAGYIPSSQAAEMPRTYACGAAREPKKKNHRAGKVVGIVAACLVCAVIGGTAAGILVPKLTAGAAESAPVVQTAETRSAVNVASPVSTPKVSAAVAGTTGQEMSATDIYYNLATKQTVAITTEITYTNVWGMTSTGAVKGSGFIISEDGYILTNHHVIEDAVKGGYEIEVLLYDGSKYAATVVGYYADNDVAVLKIDAQGLSPVTIGDSDALLVGEPVYAVGNPLGELEFSMTDGMVSATGREITTSENGKSNTISMFQISAAINSGNSGGPVYNAKGEVVGIATAKYSSTGVEGLGFAIPINTAISLANDLIADGYVHGKAYMGITVDTVTASAAQYYGLVEGAIVTSVTSGSSAEKAGIKESDIIVALGDTEVRSHTELGAAKKAYSAGDTATVRVYRSGQYLDLTITFDEETPEATAATQEQAGQGQQNPQQGGQNGQYGSGSGNGYYSDPYDFFFGANPFG